MELSPLLLDSKSGSEFLRRVETALKGSESGFSYADFARKAGFSARSYVREVFQGRKALTMKALPAFAKALGLKGEERELLRCLLAIENPGFDPSTSGDDARRKFNAKIEQIRRRSARKSAGAELNRLGDLDHWPTVYAGLGQGVDFTTLAKRTKLAGLPLERALRAMIGAGIVIENNGLYSAKDRRLVLSPELHTKMIQNHFESVLDRASQLAAKNFRDPNRAFFVSTYGVRKDRLPELKERLIETLLRFVDESEDGDDEEVVSIAAALI